MGAEEKELPSEDAAVLKAAGRMESPVVPGGGFICGCVRHCRENVDNEVNHGNETGVLDAFEWYTGWGPKADVDKGTKEVPSSPARRLAPSRPEGVGAEGSKELTLPDKIPENRLGERLGVDGRKSRDPRNAQLELLVGAVGAVGRAMFVDATWDEDPRIWKSDCVSIQCVTRVPGACVVGCHRTEICSHCLGGVHDKA